MAQETSDYIEFVNVVQRMTVLTAPERGVLNHYQVAKFSEDSKGLATLAIYHRVPQRFVM